MTEQLRTAAQAALDALLAADLAMANGGILACHASRKQSASAIEALRAALAEPQPEPVPVVPREFRAALRKLVFMARTSGGTAGPDSGLMAALDEAERVLTLPYLNAAPQAQQPQPEPGAQSRTIREIICYIRENDLGSTGDEWIAALQVPQAQQPRFVKPWQERLPRSPMNCSASEVVAAQQAEIDEWRNGHALQPLKERPDFIAGYTAGLADGKACAERDALEQPKSEPAAQNDWMWEDCSTALESMTCPWCDRQGTDICQHADDAKNCEKTK